MYINYNHKTKYCECFLYASQKYEAIVHACNGMERTKRSTRAVAEAAVVEQISPSFIQTENSSHLV